MEDRLCARPRAGGRDLDEGAGERPGRPREAPALLPVQMRADPGAPPGLRPAGQPGGEGGGPRCQSGPATRALCRPARRPTRGRGARGEGRGGPGRAAPGEEARSGRMALACGPYSQETSIMQNHPHECEQALVKPQADELRTYRDVARYIHRLNGQLPFLYPYAAKRSRWWSASPKVWAIIVRRRKV